MKTKQITGAQFLSKIGDYKAKDWKYFGSKPAIIDFYADWCAPCSVTSPMLDELAKEYGGIVDIYKIDTEKEVELSAAFDIRMLPSIVFVPVNGKPQVTYGAIPKAALRDTINNVLLRQ